MICTPPRRTFLFLIAKLDKLNFVNLITYCFYQLFVCLTISLLTAFFCYNVLRPSDPNHCGWSDAPGRRQSFPSVPGNPVRTKWSLSQTWNTNPPNQSSVTKFSIGIRLKCHALGLARSEGYPMANIITGMIFSGSSNTSETVFASKPQSQTLYGDYKRKAGHRYSRYSACL